MRKHVGRFPLVVGTAGAVAKAGTSYSESVSFRLTSGVAAVLLTSTAGSITVSQQVSNDGNNWYTPYSTAGAVLGVLGAGITVTTGLWIAFDPVMAPYTRFKVVEANSAATVVTVELMFQEDI